KKALETIPDVIISDIMMPEMDGLELCAFLKQDERTSHIPVILLTARAGEEDQYEGLENGADDYVTKPFKIKLIKSRVQNLINSRRLLRQRYSQEIVLKPRDIAITNLDEQFLTRVQDVLDANLTEPAFKVKEFSEHMGMSRMQLHRKLKALTGHTASEFIRSQRLKMAVVLLEKSDASISEIAYQVGFNDPSYFAKCFKEAYGCTPKAYLYA
ncbi:MAG: helix-turn-helix domain-containing protein, partial [Bacteroidota bacterium]